MANEADIAQEYIIDQNEVASATISAELALRKSKPSSEFCLDCDAAIPLQRQETGDIHYCVECQTIRDRYPHLRYDSRGKVIKQPIVDDETSKS